MMIIFFFSIVGRILFDNVELISKKGMHKVNFSNVFYSFNSHFKLMFKDSLDELFKKTIGLHFFYFLFILIYELASNILMQGIMGSIFYFFYKLEYIKIVN